MTPKLLLDTHILVRWLAEQQRLSREQMRALRDAAHRGDPLALSDITLLEIAVLFGRTGTQRKTDVHELLSTIESEGFRVIPIDIEIAAEIAAMGDALSDPADRAIVATARVHHLSLVTSDQRIIESRLVSAID